MTDWRQRPDSWAQARAAWLGGKAPNTRRAYDQALRLFQDFCGVDWWEVDGVTVGSWQTEMRERGLLETTINLRLSALSSFFAFCMHRYVLRTQEGREVALAATNPVRRVERATIRPYGKATYLCADQVRALLSTIRRTSARGARDYALLMTYIYTGRRNAEVRRLRWGDLQQRDGKMFYRWQGKGRKREDELPTPAWDAIREYLTLTEQLNGHGMAAEAYLFTALSDAADRLPNVEYVEGRPISGQMANKILRKWARRAGLRASEISIHTLRHTAAMLRKEAGADISDLRAFLGHATLGVTQVYVEHAERHGDDLWQSVAEILEEA